MLLLFMVKTLFITFTNNDSTEASQFKSDGKTLYCLEVVKYFNSDEANSMNLVRRESNISLDITSNFYLITIN